MTNREILKKELLNYLIPKMNIHGFKFKTKDVEFYKEFELGTFKFHIIFLTRANGWEINIGMSTRIDLVENLFHNISDFEYKYQRNTPTIAVTIENYLKNSNSYRFELSEVENVSLVCENIFQLFCKVVLPFFNKFDTIEKIDTEINKIKGNDKLTGHIYIGMKALILAKLANRLDYKEIESFYLEYYNLFSDGFYKKNYLNLMELLDNM